MRPRDFDFEALEEALDSGSVHSRQEFYALAGARWGEQRRRLRMGLFRRHRAILDHLPNATTSSHRSRQKLTEEQVCLIHEYHAHGERPAILARCHGVSTATIYDILSGRTWSHLHPTHQHLEAS